MIRVKYALLLFTLMFQGVTFLSCQKSRVSQSQADSSAVCQDTIGGKDSTMVDSTKFEAVPLKADVYFNDFIYSFTSNPHYQMERIAFPLVYEKNGKQTMITRSQWRYNRLYTRDEYYTVFFDKESSLDLEKSQEVSEVTIEYLDMISEVVKNYYFSRLKGQWMLRKIWEEHIDDYYDRDFVLFFERFVSDSIYQAANLVSNIEISMADPDDEFETLSGTIEAEQWFSFRPELPQDRFYNVNYGQKVENKKHRMVALEGSSNGFLSLLFFRYHEEKGWLMYKLKS